MFDTDDQSNQPNTSSNDALTTKLAEIKNEDGKQKYDDLDTAIEALKHSQEFIPSLKKEKDDLARELQEAKMEIERRAAVEDVVARLSNKDEQPQEQKETPSNSGLDAASVEQMLANMLAQREASSQRQLNQSSVENALREKFGDNASTKFQEIAKESQMTVEDLQELSAKSPQLVLKLIPEPIKQTSVQHGSINSTGMFSNAPNESGRVQKSEQSMLSGASSSDLAAEMRRHREAVYNRLGVQS